jgi:hypothetical protein
MPKRLKSLRKKLNKKNKTKRINKLGGAARSSPPLPRTLSRTNTCSSDLFYSLYNNDVNKGELNDIFSNKKDNTIEQALYQLTLPSGNIEFMLNQPESDKRRGIPTGIYLNWNYSYLDTSRTILHVSIHPGLYQSICDGNDKGNMHIVFDLPEDETPNPNVVRLGVSYDPDDKKRVVFLNTKLPVGYNPFKLEIIDKIIKLFQIYIDKKM